MTLDNLEYEEIPLRSLTNPITIKVLQKLSKLLYTNPRKHQNTL